MSADEQRFQAMHAETYADLLRFVQRRLPAAEAEDVVAVVFLTAWRRFADVPPDARPWLYGVARRTIANHLRGLRRYRAVDVRIAEQPQLVAGDDLTSATDRIDLVRAWRTLSAADREVLALIAFDALTGEQAAAVLGCRRSTFTMRLARARQRLRQAMDVVGAGNVRDDGEQSWTTI